MATASRDRPDVSSIEASFAAFFTANRTVLYRALYLLTGDRDEADDISQEALVRVWSNWSRVSRMDRPTGYLFRTALNVFRQRARSVKRRRWDPLAVSADGIEAADTRDELSRAVARLSPRRRIVLILVEVLGFEREEVAIFLRVRPGSVRMMLTRAKRDLRAHLGGEAE